MVFRWVNIRKNTFLHRLNGRTLVSETSNRGSNPCEGAKFMHDENDKISCGCGNKFKVFEPSKRWRLMSCIKCRKVWWITCSGRRLRGQMKSVRVEGKDEKGRWVKIDN